MLLMKNKQEIREVKVVPCEVFSRVVGYFRPVQHWNEGKREEFKDRNYLKMEKRNGSQ
jgi:anaerobic ribonucleoside-triphosphate reductase